jgi:acetolactate synthase-1/2/3 large subunit
MVKESSALVPAFKAAYRIAVNGRAGPVLIDVPRDVQIGSADQGSCLEPAVKLKTIPEPDPTVVAAIVNLLLKAERPVILAGGGVCWSGATGELLALAETLGIPIVTTFPGKNCVPTNHPLVMGPAGMHGRVESDAALINSDVVFAVGTRFSDRTIGNFSEFQKGRSIIHVDIDKSEIGKNVKPSLAVVGDVKAVIRMMLQIIPDALIMKKNQERYLNWLKQIKRAFEEYREKAAAEFPGFAPWKVLKVIREAVPPQTITTTGVGSHQMWCELHWDVYVPGTFITSAGLGTMGFGLPAALGAKAALRDRPVVNIDGDGSFQMSMANLALIKEYGLPVVNVVFNNSALMLVRHWQVMQYNNRIIATEFSANPDFTKIAEAYGIEAVRPTSYEELGRSVSRVIRNDEPLLVDVTIDRQRDFVLPFAPSGKWLKEVLLPEGFKADLDYRGD